jgi:hypothetical protein
MCQQSAVINGRYDSKGRLEEGQPTPIGKSECLRLVGEFQRDTDGPDTSDAVKDELQNLREQQDQLRQYVAERVDAAEQLHDQQEVEHQSAQRAARSRPTPPPAQITEQIIHEPYLSNTKRSKMAALLGDNEDEEGETEQ